jgi:hypothetical protein
LARFAYPSLRLGAPFALGLALSGGPLATYAATVAQGDRGDFSIDAYTPSSTDTVGGRASLDLNLSSLQTSVQASVEGGGVQTADDPFAMAQRGQSWTGSQARLTTVWTPGPAASVEFDLTNQLKRSLSQLDPLQPQIPGQLTSTQSQSAKLTASLTPFSPIELHIGGEATSGSVDTVAFPVLGVVAAASNLRNDTGRAFADVTWKPGPRFSLQAGDGLETLGVAAGASGGSGATYAYLTPHVAGAFTPWTDAEWSLSAEHAVAPPDAAQFAAFITTPDRQAAASFQPDRAWRYVASVKQTLRGDVSLSASLTQSNLQSVTDLGPVGLIQAPVSIGAGQRRQVDLAVSAPLPLPWLPPARLSASADWLRSEVTDPFTGARRPISGDAPYRAQVNLTGQFAKLPLTWALKAQVSGPQAVYQMSQVDLFSPTAGLGGALNYKAGKLVVGLQLDNIVGGGRTDTAITYAGSRAISLPEGVHQTFDDGRAVRISLSRPL